MNKIKIFDTTLRDGEQSPGATLFLKEKIKIAHLLEDLGVDIIEAGFAASSKSEKECITIISKELTQATICSLARATKPDILAAGQALSKANHPRINTFLSTSSIHIQNQLHISEERVLELINESISYAYEFCDDVEWSAMDATRSNFEFLLKAVKVAIDAKAKTINIGDTVGYITPAECHQLISDLVAHFPDTSFSIHCHNDLGLATANSLAALEAGAKQVECTVNGIGERAGNAALEEIVMAIKARKDFYNLSTNVDSKKIYHVSRTLSAITGFLVQKNKAIVGLNAFSHESGIHQDGYLKNRITYEIIHPTEIGLANSNIVLGKHSGRAALRDKIEKFGINLDDKQLDKVFKKFKALADSKKDFSDQDLIDIIQDKKFSLYHKRIIDFSFNIKSSKENQFLARIDLTLQHEEIITSKGAGETAIEAIIKAINKGLKLSLELESIENHVFFYKGDSKAESTVTVKYNDSLYTESSSNKDPLQCAVQAYINAINKLFLKSPLTYDVILKRFLYQQKIINNNAAIDRLEKHIDKA